MAKLQWDTIGERFYETGIDKGVLYVMDKGKYEAGVAWNGLTAVTESPSGAEANDQYADNIKYLSIRSAESFGLTIECLTYPDKWKLCDGAVEVTPGVYVHQQSRKAFGLSYRTIIGNDTENNDYGYKLHLVWGCTASPSELNYNTVNDSPEPGTFSYECTTTQTPIDGHKPTSLITIDSTKINPELLKQIEDILYGTDEEDARLPEPAELIKMIEEFAA